MKTYKSIISNFITENDIRCVPDQRGNVWFNLEDVVKSLKLNMNNIIDKITIISYTIYGEDMLFISRKTIGFLITQSETKYAKEMFTSSGYKFKWYK